MSGRVDVLAEPDGRFVVACFNSKCWEHGEYGTDEPWIEDYATKPAAEMVAKVHRQEIRDQLATCCPTCGRPAPPTTQPRTPAGSTEEATS